MRGQSIRDEDLLQDMRIAAAACPRGALSQHRYAKIGRFASHTIRRRFGSWDAAMRIALPDVMELRHPTAEQMIADLHRMADKCREIVSHNNELHYREVHVRRFTDLFYGAHGLYGYKYVMQHLAREYLKVTTWPEMKLALGITDV